jgi:hypothetical protein
MLGVDGLHRLYSSNNPVAAIARGVGVTIVDALTPVKVIIKVPIPVMKSF